MSTRRFQSIPPISKNNIETVAGALSEVVGYVTGQTQPAIKKLDTIVFKNSAGAVVTPTNDQLLTAVNAVATKLNEVISRLQGV